MKNGLTPYRLGVWMAALALVVSAVPASASTFLAMDTKSLVEKSQAVVQGQVIEVESFWDENRVVIVTEALIRVDEAIHGKSERFIKVRTFGGEVDGYTVVAHGFPVFAAEEEVVLFVRQSETEGAALRVTGFQQGHFEVVEKNGAEVAVPTIDHDVVLLPLPGVKAAPAAELPLAQLKNEIRAAAQELGANPVSR